MSNAIGRSGSARYRTGSAKRRCCCGGIDCESEVACEHCSATPGFWRTFQTNPMTNPGCVTIAAPDSFATHMLWDSFFSFVGAVSPQVVACPCRWTELSTGNKGRISTSSDACATVIRTGDVSFFQRIEVTATKVKLWIISNSGVAFGYGGPLIVFYGEADFEGCGITHVIPNSLVAGDVGNIETIVTDCGADEAGLVVAYGGSMTLVPCEAECEDSIEVTLDFDAYICTECVSVACLATSGSYTKSLAIDGTYTLPKSSEHIDVATGLEFCVFEVDISKPLSAIYKDSSDCSGPFSALLEADATIIVSIWKTSRGVRSCAVLQTTNYVNGAPSGPGSIDGTLVFCQHGPNQLPHPGSQLPYPGSLRDTALFNTIPDPGCVCTAPTNRTLCTNSANMTVHL